MVRFADRLRSLFNWHPVGKINRYSQSLASLTAATDNLPVGRAKVDDSSSRPWYRPFPSSCFLTVTLLLMVSALVIPGEITGSGGGFYSSVDGGGGRVLWTEFEHGWPCVFLQRTIYGSAPNESGPPWSQSNAWLLGRGDEFQFELLALVSDTAMLVVLVSLSVGIFNTWRSHRRSLFVWRLTDLFALVAVVAGALGFYQSYRSECLERFDVETQIEAAGHELKEYHAPKIATRLLGSELIPEWTWRPTAVRIGPCGRGQMNTLVVHLNAVPSICRIEFSGSFAFQPEQLEVLVDARHIHTLDIAFTDVDESYVPTLLRFGHLKTIDVADTLLSTTAVATLRHRLDECEIVSE